MHPGRCRARRIAEVVVGILGEHAIIVNTVIANRIDQRDIGEQVVGQARDLTFRVNPLDMITGKIRFTGSLPGERDIGPISKSLETPYRFRAGNVGVVDDDRRRCRINSLTDIGGDRAQLVDALCKVQRQWIETGGIRLRIVRRTEIDPDAIGRGLELKLYTPNVGRLTLGVDVLGRIEACTVAGRDDYCRRRSRVDQQF